jgi:hypothetical protein
VELLVWSLIDRLKLGPLIFEGIIAGANGSGVILISKLKVSAILVTIQNAAFILILDEFMMYEKYVKNNEKNKSNTNIIGFILNYS